MPIGFKVSIDAGAGLTALANSASVIWQGTLSASKPIRLKRIRMASNATGSTQLVVPLQIVTYATGTATGGSTPTPTPVDKGVTTAASTAFRTMTATLGTTPTVLWSDAWNDANPYDNVEGLLEIQEEFPVSTILAMIVPSAPGAGIQIVGSLWFEEFG